ncbi:MAG: dienelactone hydrolase family protein [Candidatus Thermoplasmatota archaeon]|nr:dienelactone hydrolase family protein [Candidatus Thermoplasmatota archaeon]
MRSLVFALSILLLSCSFAGCASDGDRDFSEDPISEIDRGGLGEDTNETSTISSEDCEERGGTWNEEREECSFESERPEPEPEPEPDIPEEDDRVIYVPPCNMTATEGLNSTANPSSWPEIKAGQWLAVDGLTDVSYDSIELDNESEVVVDARLDYECGYTYSVKVPAGYNTSNEYPVFLFLHGEVYDSAFFNNMLTNNFHMPDDDKYIIVRPSKLELDWDPKKVLDVLEDVKSNLNVDDDRVYLTGLSMGGRGTFIVAAALPDYFAAIMPLTPHHQPYSYLPLAEEVAHLPIWMSHGTADNTSSYEMAAQMAENLTNLGANIIFVTVIDGGHGGWFNVYIDPIAMEWMLSHVRNQ